MPSTLKDTYDKLKSSIVGTKTVDIDAKLDAAVKDIMSYKTAAGQSSYVELLKHLLVQTNIGSDINLSQGLFSQTAMSPAALGQGERLQRYKAYEAIIYNISYCFRALNVLIDNIISPDDITKISLEVKPTTFLEQETETESRVQHIKEVIRDLKLENSLHKIVRNTLLFGDLFLEVADSKTALMSRSILMEADNDPIIEDDNYLETVIEMDSGEVFDTTKKEMEKSGADKLIFGDSLVIKIDYSGLSEELETRDRVNIVTTKYDDEKEKGKNREDQKVEKMELLIHEPKKVIKLQSEMFPICFGYLVFPSLMDNSMLSMLNPSVQAINNICMQILKSLEKKIPNMSEYKADNDLRTLIAGMIRNGNFYKPVTIRYVAPGRMQHFTVPSTKYMPYGESIFEPVQFSSKVLIALETALTIQRLNRSTEKRKILVELGIPRDARKAIEQVREQMKKRKISLDSFGTVDTIPSMVTTFEDVYIPQKDGKPFIDIATFTEGNVDVRSKVDELKFLRDQIIAALGVPASFLNIEENLSNKSALSEENILFARTVISHQKYISHQINDFIQKVYSIINPEKAISLLDNITIVLPPPKSLQFEREARYLQDVATMIRTLEELGIPKEWSMKKYIQGIDWEDLERYKTKAKLDKPLEKPEEEGGLGISGGFGGIGGLGPTGGMPY